MFITTELIAECLEAYACPLDLVASTPASITEVHRPPRGTDPKPHAAGAESVTCCPSDCQGQECAKSRILMRKLASELVQLVSTVQTITRADSQSSDDVSYSFQKTQPSFFQRHRHSLRRAGADIFAPIDARI